MNNYIPEKPGGRYEPIAKNVFSNWESELVWPVVTASTMLLVIGLTALLTRQPWLFPSLGPTAYLFAKYPDLPVSRTYNSMVGHLVGIGGGFAGVAIFNAWQTPIVPLYEVSIARVLAAAAAMGLTILINGLLRSEHPPAAATALLVALGTFNNVNGAMAIAVGVLILVVTGKGLQYLQTTLLKKRKHNSSLRDYVE